MKRICIILVAIASLAILGQHTKPTASVSAHDRGNEVYEPQLAFGFLGGLLFSLGSSLLGNVFNQRAARKERKRIEASLAQQRLEAQTAFGNFDSALNPLIQSFGEGNQALIDRLRGQIDPIQQALTLLSGQAGQDVNSLIGDATSGLENALATALASNDSNARRAIASGSADIRRSLNDRGLLNSTGVESQLVSSLLPAVENARLSAEAQARGDFARSIAQTRLGGAQLQNQSLATQAGVLGQLGNLSLSGAGFENSLAQQLLNLQLMGPTARVSAFGQPNALFPSPVTFGGSSLFGDLFSSLGAGVLGGLDFGSLFGSGSGARVQNASGTPDISRFFGGSRGAIIPAPIDRSGIVGLLGSMAG